MTIRSWTAAGVLALAIVGAPSPSSAQSAPREAVSPPTAEKLALAQDLVIAIDAQASMKRMVQIMTDQFGKSFGAATGDRQVADLMTDVMREEMADVMRQTLPLLAGVYAETFDAQELRDLLAFYRSPTGRKLVERLPELSRRSQAAIAPMLPQVQRHMITTMFARVCELKHCTDEQRKALDATKATVFQRLDAQQAAQPANPGA